MTEQLSMGTHPDIVTLRARYESASETAAGQIFGGTTFLAGLYLAVSPFVVGFEGLTPMLFTNLIVGVAVALLGLGLTAAFDRTHRLAWTVPILAIFTIVAPWIVQQGDFGTSENQWNNVVTGTVLLLVSLGPVSMAMGRSKDSLLRKTRRVG